jgi:hypothetical protein
MGFLGYAGIFGTKKQDFLPAKPTDVWETVQLPEPQPRVLDPTPDQRQKCITLEKLKMLTMLQLHV